jgi:hypothetical protein
MSRWIENGSEKDCVVDACGAVEEVRARLGCTAPRLHAGGRAGGSSPFLSVDPTPSAHDGSHTRHPPRAQSKPQECFARRSFPTRRGCPTARTARASAARPPLGCCCGATTAGCADRSSAPSARRASCPSAAMRVRFAILRFFFFLLCTRSLGHSVDQRGSLPCFAEGRVSGQILKNSRQQQCSGLTTMQFIVLYPCLTAILTHEQRRCARARRALTSGATRRCAHRSGARRSRRSTCQVPLSAPSCVISASV